MYIAQVVSYGNAWNILNESFPDELKDLRAAIDELSPQENKAVQPPPRLEDCWVSGIRARSWEASDSYVQSAGGRRMSMHGLGFIRNNVSVRMIRHREILNRWLYTVAPIAVRNGLVEIPICVCFTRSTEEILYPKSPRAITSSLDWTKDELMALAPLSHPNPFLLIGLSLNNEHLLVTEISSEDNGVERNIIINRSIEFPPQYHQAGLGILSYFGTVLREKYPDHKAKVRIEQDGLRVRLIIESENGDKEIIEKALQEYELVVRGESEPDTFFASKAKVLELKNELRIAQVRIDSQRDLIELRNEEVATLRQLIGHSLSIAKPQPIAISVSPTIVVNATNTLHVQQNTPEITEAIQLLCKHAADTPDVELRLLDLEESLAALSLKQTPDEVKRSGGMTKLKRWIDEAATAGTSANGFLKKVNDGVELMQKIARRYNALAEWCGAPQVPSVFLGKDN